MASSSPSASHSAITEAATMSTAGAPMPASSSYGAGSTVLGPPATVDMAQILTIVREQVAKAVCLAMPQSPGPVHLAPPHPHDNQSANPSVAVYAL